MASVGNGLPSHKSTIVKQLMSNGISNHGFQGIVILEHALPNGEVVYSLYGHLMDIETFNPGQCIEQGTKLGLTGGLPDNHLHFEIKDRPVLHNPDYPDNPLNSHQWCRDPISHREVAKCFGYTFAHPDNHGYHDPIKFFHIIDQTDFPRSVLVTEDGVSIRVGPGGLGANRYRCLSEPCRESTLRAETYQALGKSDGTSVPNCPEGWYQIQPIDGTQFGDRTRPRSSIPDAWICSKFVSD
jgi:hypothetical protein